MSTLLEAFKKESVLDVFNFLTLNRQQFVGDSIPYDLETYKNDAVDYKNLIISTPVWASNILELDEFSINLNKKLLKYQEKSSFWDSEIEGFLDDNGYDISLYEHHFSNYTYNFEYCLLDRDIHFTLFDFDDCHYVALSVHYGADARAGFSDCFVFNVKDMDYFYNSMEITAYTASNDEDISIFELEDIATFNEENKEWILNETNEQVIVYSSANGF